MRKLLLTALIAATVIPGVATAQTGELRRDRQDIREEQRELRHAQRYGDRRDVREERRDVQDARREYREDWRDYRRDHRDVYRGAGWRAPFRYQRWQSGARIAPVYYNHYVIRDYGRYRLPRPAANTYWVRHYNDVLLVNHRTGRVVRVYNNFYW